VEYHSLVTRLGIGNLPATILQRMRLSDGRVCDKGLIKDLALDATDPLSPDESVENQKLFRDAPLMKCTRGEHDGLHLRVVRCTCIYTSQRCQTVNKESIALAGCGDFVLSPQLQDDDD